MAVVAEQFVAVVAELFSSNRHKPAPPLPERRHFPNGATSRTAPLPQLQGAIVVPPDSGKAAGGHKNHNIRTCQLYNGEQLGEMIVGVRLLALSI